ncbi:MAG: serine hydrolase domain-containing protein, partial [Gemmatimonadales bacterium]
MMLVGLALMVPLLQSPGDEVRRSVQRGIDAGVFPGAVVVVGTADTLLFAEGVGRFTWSPESSVPDPDSTLFDLASLTKVVATTAAVMSLVDQRRIDLDAPVSHYLAEFRGRGKIAVTVLDLLQHTSGLRAFLPLNELTGSPDEARRRVLAEELSWAPGSRVVYSDLNAMLLGWVVEAVAEETLDRFVQREVFQRLGMNQTAFGVAVSARTRAMPVGLWRGHPIAGEVHDQNAARLGGRAGHAGIFATGADLARFARLFLNRGELDGIRVFGRINLARFTSRGAGNRALGWDMRDTTSTDNAGRYLTARAYGHTGF